MMRRLLSINLAKNPNGLKIGAINSVNFRFYSTKFSFEKNVLTEENLKNVMIDQNSIISVEDAIKLAKDLKQGLGKLWSNDQCYHSLVPPLKYPFGLWFRGQGNVHWGLLPRIFRPSLYGLQNETNHLQLFQSANPQYASHHNTTFEWLSLMQHYSSPTRLLDWTESILIGLYFAVSNPREDGHDGALWILNAARLNSISTLYGRGVGVASPTRFDVIIRSEMALVNDVNSLVRRHPVQTSDEFDTPSREQLHALDQHIRKGEIREKLSMPIAVYPRRISERLKAQSGVFTLYGGKSYFNTNTPDYSDALPLSQDLFSVNEKVQNRSLGNISPFLKVIKISGLHKKIIREQLFELGIHQGSIFAELDYQSNYLKEQWTTPINPNS